MSLGIVCKDLFVDNLDAPSVARREYLDGVHNMQELTL